jgi:hypothetical protein
MKGKLAKSIEKNRTLFQSYNDILEMSDDAIAEGSELPLNKLFYLRDIESPTDEQKLKLYKYHITITPDIEAKIDEFDEKMKQYATPTTGGYRNHDTIRHSHWRRSLPSRRKTYRTY